MTAAADDDLPVLSSLAEVRDLLYGLCRKTPGRIEKEAWGGSEMMTTMKMGMGVLEC